MADSNIQTPDTVKPITLDEYEERTAHLQENTTSLLSAIEDKQVQASGLATQAYSLASEVNAVAEQVSLSFSKKTWKDNATSGTPITAAELNRLENAISNLTTAVNNLQDSVSQDNDWLTLNEFIKYRKTGNIVTVVGESVGIFGFGGKDEYSIVGTLPSEYCPSICVPVVFHNMGGESYNNSAYITKTGEIKLYDRKTYVSYWGFCVSYPI